MNHDIPIFDPYLSTETLHLVVTGLVAGASVGLLWRAMKRRRWGPAPVMLATLGASLAAHRHDLPNGPKPVLVFGAIIVVMAGVGGGRVLAAPDVRWGSVAAGALVSAGAVWAAVPETGPALLVGGVLCGSLGTAALTRSRLAPSGAAALAATVGWAALAGAAGHPWAVAGGALCLGVAPWFAVTGVLPSPPWALPLGGWVLVAHALLAVLAARWIAVMPRPGWGRVAIVAAAAAGLAASARSKT